MATTLLSLSLIALLAAAPAATGLDEEDLEQEAAEQLREAEEQVAAGRHSKAVAAYEKISERYAQTRAGRAAARRTSPNALIGWADIQRNGPSENRADIVVMGEGYLLKKQRAFDSLADDVPKLLDIEPLVEEYGRYFNFLRANVVSEEDGIDGFGRQASTALGGRVIEGSNSGNVTVDHQLVREVLYELPAHDGVALVFVQRGDSGSGARGVAAIGGRASARMLLRYFGQAFAGLYLEFDTDDGIPRGAARNELNLANTSDPERVPWAHFIEARVPGVGVYRGGNGRLDGVWRPTTSQCVMGGGDVFCPVCREIVLLTLLDLVDPIELQEPGPELELRGSEPHELRIEALRPATHDLEASWWILPEELAPPPPPARRELRRHRGPLAPIDQEPVSVDKRSKKGIYTLEVDPAELTPGRYRVLCRVRDTAEPRGERYPWVLRDEHGLLESERSWVLVVE
jgi:hypothetical protein